LDAPPREAALARALEARLETIERGELGAGSEDGLDAALALAVREAAREELERHRLTGTASDLRRATLHLERAVALAPGDPPALVLLARALARQPVAARERL